MLTATYRLQMNAGFTLAQARTRVDYFAALGVSHLYLSPIFAARRGSMHGYDVVDPTRVNPEIGTEADVRVLSQELHRRGMGLILDIVPNHMGIGPENPYWDDVLTLGERSPYARWFDIDRVGGHDAHRKLTLPVLADELERVIERGEISVELAAGAGARIRYFAHSFPIDPATLPPELQLAQSDPEETHELADVYSAPEGRERLRALLDAQHYRLEFWRRGPREINYRRFFDVNDLAALRMEDPRVFSETHEFVLRLVREGTVDGLRIDHIDGLLDPAAYLRRLRAETPPETLIFVEKILSSGEELPEAWPVQGTTGYEFLNELEDVFVDPAGFSTIELRYRRMRGMEGETFQDIARRAKSNVLRGPLHADVDRLVAVLAPMASAAGHGWPTEQMAEAVADLIAALPVYRTYVGPDGRIGGADATIVERASRRAQATSASPHIVAWIAGVVLDIPPQRDGVARVRFVQRLQQLSGPAAAKGVEDTALYDYVPLASRNEVGGAPDRSLDDAVGWLHRSNERRAARHPLALLATNTHDAKRSADVRARLDALSEMPEEWERAVCRWRQMTERHRRTVNGQEMPGLNTEYLLYQTLVALWPSPSRERLVRYMTKAAREAKLRTNWVNPDRLYEEALEQFVAAIFETPDGGELLADVSVFARRAATAAARNALSRVAIHLTSPGTPDIYQGDELWNYALVDPDNRGQVDYDARSARLAELASLELSIGDVATLDLFDDRVKLLVTHRLLALRRAHAGLFRQGDYRPLAVRGRRAAHVFAFARSLGGHHAVTIAPRLTGSLDVSSPRAQWGDTSVLFADDMAATRWHDAITGDALAPCRMLEVAAVAGKLPVVVIAS